MSASSILSTRPTRPTGWKINVRLASIMDSIFAIGFGLGLRFVVDAVSHHDFKITGTLVGLWEGVIMLHFTKKMPKSNDPFIAYGVRLFIDFLCTESVTRLVIVLIWTALGMVLADVTPAIWDEVGLKRAWRHFRRDLYTISRVIPTVAFFPPPRTVRFSPSREPPTIIEPEVNAVSPPSVITTEQTNTVPPPTIAPPTREILKRRVPGYFPADFSDTETEPGSVLLGPSPGERTSRRLSIYPVTNDFDESVSSQNDLDDENLSSVSSSTERAGTPSAVIEARTIPDMYTEEVLVDVAALPVKDEDEMLMTPKPSAALYMPPTPSDSALHFPRPQPSKDRFPVPPLSELAQIPDYLEEPNTEDWENIQRQEATEGKPPTPPAKDDAYKPKVPIITAPVPPQPQQKPSTPPPPPQDETKEWDMMESQILSNPNDNNNAISNDQQEPYQDFDDIYGNEAPAPQYSAFSTMAESSSREVPSPTTADFTSGPDPWRGVMGHLVPSEFEEKLQKDQEEADRRKREEEDAARKQAEEEALKRKQDEEEAAERLRERKAQEKEERLKKEAEDEAIRQRKREEEAAERRRKELEEAAERMKKEEEEREKAEQKKKEEVERKKREVEEAKKLAAETKRLKEEEEERKKQEEAERKVAKAAQRKRDALEAAERREYARKEAEKKRLEEEAETAAVDAAIAQANAEEEEWKKEEEATAKRLKDEQEAARVKAEKEAWLRAEEERQIEQEEASHARDEETGRPEATAEPIPPDDAEQDLEKDLPRPPLIETQDDEVTAASEASDDPPDKASDRLDRMLLLRAQMVQLEGRLQQLESPESDQEIKQIEKTLRKFRRQAERRYEAGIYLSKSKGKDDESTILLEGMHPKTSEKKIEERLEALLPPDAKSLHLKITVAKKASDAQKQKPKVVMLLDKYNLAAYTTESATNKKISIVNIPEEKFADWLTGYRILLARREEEEEEPGFSSVWS